MQNFDVLNRHQPIRQSFFIEASAGTGKTFTIENIVVRLLLESDKQTIPLEKILVMTFTRSAAKDLKARIRKNIEKALYACHTFSKTEQIDLTLPDYLIAIFEKGLEDVYAARRKLEDALYQFDQAQIFTIHAFCWRMLSQYVFEGNIGLQAIHNDEGVSKAKIRQVILDFFRTEIHPDIYSPAQLDILLKNAGYDTEKLVHQLLQEIEKGFDIEASPDFSMQLKLFQEAMRKLKFEYGLTSQNMMEDFFASAKCYGDVCDRSKNIKKNIIEKVQSFAVLFDAKDWSAEDFEPLIADGLVLLEIFQESNLLKRAVPQKNALHYPNLIEILKKELQPIVESARSKASLFSRLASYCQKFVRQYLSEEEILGFDDLLKAMHAGIKNQAFAEKIRGNYQAAIIDEFQDTDPLQWEIFTQLFIEAQDRWRGFLYLVGDPKQSIYAFRSADIYTYLAASRLLGEKTHVTLGKNFRSQVPLVSALNHLFSSSPGLMQLPRLSQCLTYKPVEAGVKAQKEFGDVACMQFFIARSKSGKKGSFPEAMLEQQFFPHIANEICWLRKDYRYNQIAILISTRYQGARLSAYLTQLNIPCTTQKNRNLADSPALPAMRELLQGVLHAGHESSLKIALGGIICGWTHDDLRNPMPEERREQILASFYAFRHILLEEGFISFYDQFMRRPWDNTGKSIVERLLASEGGAEFYQDLQQIAELLAAQQCEAYASPVDLLMYLNELEDLNPEDERLKVRQDPNQNAVHLLTVHSSKGLEYDVVFALGLASRRKESKQLIPVAGNEKVLLRAPLEQPTDFLHELDAEKARLFYVAATRAKDRLYLPVALVSDCPAELGEASPMEVFLARFGQPEASMEEVYARINRNDESLLPIEKINEETGIACVECQTVCDPIVDDSELAAELVAPEEIQIPGNALFMQSFTSLTKECEAPEEDSEEIQKFPHDFDALIKSSHTLPASAATGIVLHSILEKIPFHKMQEAKQASDLLPDVLNFVEKTSFSAWAETICSIIFQVISTPLEEVEEAFCLRDIDPEMIFREMEFMYPIHDAFDYEELKVAPGYLKGVVDMIFSYQGKYYLIDWKSNWLGPDSSFYEKEHLAKAIQANHYSLQASIYTAALKRYLHHSLASPFEEVFGGVYYFFLRGDQSVLHFPSQTLCEVVKW